VVAAAQVAVAPVNYLDGHLRHVALRRSADRARQLARRRVVLAAGLEAALPLLGDFLARGNPLREQAQRARVAVALLVVRIADDVVGDHRLDVDAFLVRSSGPMRGAEQPLLLAGD